MEGHFEKSGFEYRLFSKERFIAVCAPDHPLHKKKPFLAELLDEHLYVIENIDATIIAERPKMRPYIDEMRENIARALTLDVDQVNIKATTEEGLGLPVKGKAFPPRQFAVLRK